MPAGIFSLSGPMAIMTNADFQLMITYMNPDGTPVDLTGFNAVLTVGNARPPTITYLRLSSSGMNPAITFPSPTMGQIQLLVPYAVTSTLEVVFESVFDMLLLAPSGGIEGFLQGPSQILAGVSTP